MKLEKVKIGQFFRYHIGDRYIIVLATSGPTVEDRHHTYVKLVVVYTTHPAFSLGEEMVEYNFYEFIPLKKPDFKKYIGEKCTSDLYAYNKGDIVRVKLCDGTLYAMVVDVDTMVQLLVIKSSSACFKVGDRPPVFNLEGYRYIESFTWEAKK